MGNAAMLIALLLGGGISAALRVLQSWLRLRFLRHVYDRGGPVDPDVAGVALRSIDEVPLTRESHHAQLKINTQPQMSGSR